MQASSSAENRLLSPGLWFSVILVVMCGWVLTLPTFPSQDGPVHRYYVHVLDSLMHHQPTFDLYKIRHPFPPYATHYFLLMGLSHLASFDMAEKLLVCLIFIGFAFGLRWTAETSGPAGAWTALFFAPLLLSWSLMMGFFNYIMGLTLLLLATACWQRSRKGSPASIALYLLALAVLTFTHPIPLLLLISITALDLVLNWAFRSKALASGRWARQEAIRIFAFVCTLLAFAFPAMAVDHSASTTANTLADTHFKIEYVRTAILLTGMSPYNSRSTNLWIDLYRVCLYAILLVGFYLAARVCIRALRDRQPNLGTTLFLSTILLLIALPILPNSVNGSWYFSTRLVMVLWPGVLIAAGVAAAPRQKYRPLLIAAAVVCCVLSLIPAQIFFRPIAKQNARAERITLPQGQHSVIVLSNELMDYTRYQKQLAFNPYEWATLLPMEANNEIVLDTPWMDQKITPLLPVSSTPLTLEDISATHTSKTAPPMIKGHSLPASEEAPLIHHATLIAYSGPPEILAHGLGEQLTPAEAAQFACALSQNWLMICHRK